MTLKYNPLLPLGLDDTGSGGGGSGDVVGPASATDNAIARYDSTTGKLIQNSVVIVSDTGEITGVTNLIATNTIIVDSPTDASISVDRGSNGLNREAVIDFSTAGVTKYRIGMVQSHSGSDAFLSIVDDFSNELVKIEDKGATAEMTVDTVIVADEAYGAGWNGSLEVPTKNAVYDKIETISAGSGITRSITISSGNFTAGASASTDYVYLIAGAHTCTLPTAVSNTNLYTIKNNHSANVTIDTTSSQTIDGTTSISIAPQESVSIISTNTNWSII